MKTIKSLYNEGTLSGKTLLGIGPVSEMVVVSAIAVSKRNSSPVIFIASRNQVDLMDFGGGYLMGGMDQRKFVRLIKDYAAKLEFTGPIYICRDHGGPWQRDQELDCKIAVAEAMDIAKRSFREDIITGFNYIHVDPTKCPHQCTMDDIVGWSVELIDFCELVRRENNLPEIDYEVGTEDIKGGITEPEKFKEFIEKITIELGRRGLPLPTMVVGQTGTLVKEDRNFGHFNYERVGELVNIAAHNGIGFKEHNGDYITLRCANRHPELGITGINIAPEFGLISTDAMIMAGDIHNQLHREGTVGEPNRLHELLSEKSIKQSWRKWMRNPDKTDLEDAATRMLITRVCGHYTYDDPVVKREIERVGADMINYCGEKERFNCLVLKALMHRMDDYYNAFNMEGIQ